MTLHRALSRPHSPALYLGNDPHKDAQVLVEKHVLTLLSSVFKETDADYWSSKAGQMYGHRGTFRC